MGHTHNHPHSHPTIECIAVERKKDGTYRHKEQNRLLWCIAITGLMMLVEFFGGLWTNSLALLSDAAHMFSHLFSLGVSYFAILLATREADKIRSYGFYRAEILAALFNGITLILIVVWIAYDALGRIFNPPTVAVPEMLSIAVLGLIVNLITALILKGVSEHDLNVKSAFFHMLSDTASSVGIIIAGILIYYTGKFWLDPVASLLIAVMIAIWSVSLIRDSVHILLESTPKHLSEEEIVTAIKTALPEILDIHHIHMWEISSKMCSLTAHIEIADVKVSESEALRRKVNTVLRERFHITHTNLQFECKK
ncbi:MAG: cation diffusion facilitator family transporter [Deltaproteobacteria bacterium]|nr:cation diffusion facilitator family transporter [Deltaproteobacteria bacterium]